MPESWRGDLRLLREEEVEEKEKRLGISTNTVDKG